METAAGAGWCQVDSERRINPIHEPFPEAVLQKRKIPNFSYNIMVHALPAAAEISSACIAGSILETPVVKEVYCKSRHDWRAWLAGNHDKELQGIWLVFYKKETDRPTLEYDEAVEEALCFGWIDSIIKTLDDERYARKFTPRKPDSLWSEANKKRVAKLLERQQMTEAGVQALKEAKSAGLWEKSSRADISFQVPEDFSRAMEKNERARTFFAQLAPSYKRQYIGWIAVAKRQETRNRRIKEAVELLEKGEKLGMR